MTSDVTIVGGGIAGTSLAVALADQGLSARVFERYGGDSFSGGILLVSSNAMRVLAELGLAATVLRRGVEIEAMDFRRSDGHLLWRLDVDSLAREAGAPSVVIPRAELLEILTERARTVATVQAGAFERYAEHGSGVVAELAGGLRIDAPILVGADGIRSSVRRQLHGSADEAPRETGQAVWVGATRFDDPCLPLGKPMAAMGRGLRFWAAALPGGRAYWYALFWERHRPRDLSALRRLYADFDDWVQDLVFSTRDEDVAKTVIADRRPSKLWGQGRVTLLGDAIHAVTPDLAQGACQAIESSVTLAHCLGHFGLGEQALREYETRRQKRTRRVSQLSYLTCTASMTDDPLANWLRDLGTRTLLPFIADAQLRWLFSGPQG